jgi:hypothetical protein
MHAGMGMNSRHVSVRVLSMRTSTNDTQCTLLALVVPVLAGGAGCRYLSWPPTCTVLCTVLGEMPTTVGSVCVPPFSSMNGCWGAVLQSAQLDGELSSHTRGSL